jgi:hypothetical protein
MVNTIWTTRFYIIYPVLKMKIWIYWLELISKSSKNKNKI